MLRSINEGIAIIGIGCRFPGNADSPESFWRLLRNGEDAITPVPTDRWNVDRFYHPDPEMPGKMYVRAGGFLRTPIDQFDALFFGMSPREALFLDPQQRLLLEVAWEAIEDAGLVPESLAGSDTGVYIGGFMLDNLMTQFSALNRDAIGPHSAVSSTLSMLANRLSYTFDFHGPSITIDTACSSSLVALHQACQAIRHGECSIALAGGVNVMHRPENVIAMCKGGFLSPDGRCKSFDARADGYGRGEGAGIVVLKPASAAFADGDLVYAIVRGTGVNQDGHTDGITVPNPRSQEQLIGKVCAQSGIEPRNICYVEAHGTGTPVGDPLEMAALGAVIGKGRGIENACVVGSVKSNIGHLEAAAGIAGVIKTALCLKHKTIPPLANFTTANSEIAFEQLGVRLPRGMEPMPEGVGPANAAVNSFGYGGTNAHAVLEEAVLTDSDGAADGKRQPGALFGLHLLPISARSRSALSDLVSCYRRRLRDTDTKSLSDFCYSAAVRRGHHDHRLALVASSAKDMVEQMQCFLEEGQGRGIFQGTSSAKSQMPVFVFTGMGPQWWGMGRELLQTVPVFRHVVEECDATFRRISGWSILAEMTADERISRIRETQIAQPANFVLQVALAALWRDLGIEPGAIVGHSVGEVSAAFAAGVLDLEDAVHVSFHRSRIQSKAAGLGTMLATGLTEAAATLCLAQYNGAVSLAAANGPCSTTLSGDAVALGQIAADLEVKGVFNRFLQVEMGYHSPYMDPLQSELLDNVREVRVKKPAIPLYSTVTGDLAENGAYTGAYWCDNIRKPVYFARAIESLIRDGHRVFVEIGPHPVLSPAIRECLTHRHALGVALTSLRRGQPEGQTLVEALAALYASGCSINWSRLYAEGGKFIRLPTYPWQRETYWNETEQASLDRLGQSNHPLLGQRVASPLPCWESELNAAPQAYLKDHVVENLVVFPGAGYVELGLAVHREISGLQQYIIDDLEFAKALVIENNVRQILHVRYNEETKEYFVHSGVGERKSWDLHAFGRLSLVSLGDVENLSLDDIKRRCSNFTEDTAHYRNMDRRGLHYGPKFQGVKHLWLNPSGNESLAFIVDHQAAEEDGYCLHPALLDACFQSLLAVIGAENDTNVYVPVRIRQVRLHRRPCGRVWCHGTATRRQQEALEGNVTLCDETGAVLVEVLGIKAQPLERNQDNELRDLDDWLHQFAWREVEPGNPREALGRWMIFMDRGGVGDRLVNELESAGAESVQQVWRGEVFAQERPSAYLIAPDSKEHIQRLVEDDNGAPLHGIIYLWALDEADASGDPIGISSLTTALYLIQTLGQIRGTAFPVVSFVTRGAQPVFSEELVPAQAPLVGLIRVAINEYPDLSLRVIDIDRRPETLIRLPAEILSDSPEEEVALRGAVRYVNRLVRRRVGVLEPRGNPTEREDRAAISGITLRRASPPAPGSRQVEIALRSVLIADARPRRPSVGAFRIDDPGCGGAATWGGRAGVGIVTRLGAEVTEYSVGQEVLAVLQGANGVLVTVPTDFVISGALLGKYGSETWPLIPSLASVYFAFRHVAHLRPGERVLVLGATGADGLAAIELAQKLGAEIYATAATAEQQTHLQARSVTHVFDHSYLGFPDLIRDRTGGRGIDVVINTLPSEFAISALTVLAPFGRLLDMGDLRDQVLRASAVRHFNQSLTRINFPQLMTDRRCVVDELVTEITELFDTTDLAAIPIQLLPAATDADPFEAVADARSVAPVVINFSHNPATDNRFNADASYLITGGFGGFGLELAKWLVSQGARNLVLVGRRGAATPEGVEAVDWLVKSGARVLPLAADISNETEVSCIIQNIVAAMPPLRGVFHAAAVLQDGPINTVDRAALENVMRPKALGAWHLHRHTNHLPLDYFVLFSSIGSMIGSPGQASYVAANAFLDGLAHFRRARQLPAISINWGALAKVGMVARHGEVEKYFSRVGVGSFMPAQALEVLSRVLDWNPVTIGAAIMDWQLWGEFNATWAASPRYHDLISGEGVGPSKSASQGLLEAVRRLAPEERQAMLAATFAELVAQVLRLPHEKVENNIPLLNMGLDSLMAMELQTAIEYKLNVKISTLELMKGNTISQLVQRVLSTFDAVEATKSPEPSVVTHRGVQRVGNPCAEIALPGPTRALELADALE